VGSNCLYIFTNRESQVSGYILYSECLFYESIFNTIFDYIIYGMRTLQQHTVCVIMWINGRFTLCITFRFRHCSIFVPSEWSVLILSVVFSHLPEQSVMEGLKLFLSNMSPSATECIFRYLLIIRISVMIE